MEFFFLFFCFEKVCGMGGGMLFVGDDRPYIFTLLEESNMVD